MTEQNNKWQDLAEKVSNSEEDGQVDVSVNQEDDSEIEQEESSEPSGLEHPNYQELEDKLTQAEQKAHENWEKATRALAELENVRRRAEREVANAHKFGVEKLINELLPVIDSLEQALNIDAAEAQQAIASMKQGIELTLQLFLDVLAKFKVQQIDPVGETFNPECHEAISMQPDETAKPNTVLTVFQKGYLLDERVIRPARVIVAKRG